MVISFGLLRRDDRGQQRGELGPPVGRHLTPHRPASYSAIPNATHVKTGIATLLPSCRYRALSACGLPSLVAVQLSG